MTTTLTAAGALLLSHARRIFASERAAVQALESLRDLEAGSLLIGASSTIGVYLLPQLLAVFHRRYPQVRLLLDIGNTQHVVEQLHCAPLDIAFIEGPINDADVALTLWRDDELVAIAPPDHPFASIGKVSIKQLLESPLVLREPGSRTREVVMRALSERGFVPREVLEIGSTEAIKRAVGAGLGVAIVSAATISAELRGTVGRGTNSGTCAASPAKLDHRAGQAPKPRACRLFGADLVCAFL